MHFVLNDVDDLYLTITFSLFSSLLFWPYFYPKIRIIARTEPLIAGLRKAETPRRGVS